MKRLLLSASVVIAFAVYTFVRHGSADAPLPQPVTSDMNPVTPDQPQSTPVAGQSGFATGSQPSPTTAGRYRDGSYTGDSVDAFYGFVQVAAVIRGGKLTDVQILRYPNDRSTSIEINSIAMPQLRQEAIAAQSARIDAVSGASDSSSAFIQSLDSALKKAI